MPDIKYFITTPDGNNHQVSEENIKKYGIDSYADSYKDATIRMRNDKGEDYHIPLSNYHDAVGQGLHAFRFDAKPDHSGQPPQAGSVAKQVVAEFEASQRKNRTRTPERTQQIENSPAYSTGYEIQTGDYNNPANQWGEKKLTQVEDMGRKATPKIARPTSLNIADDKGRIHQFKNVSPISNDYMPGVPMKDNSELPSRIDPNDKRFFGESDVQDANDNIRERQLNEFEGKANALGHKAAGDIAQSMKSSNPLADAITFGNTGGAVPYSNPDVLDNDDAINAQAITNQVKDARELIREHKNTSKNPLLRAARGAGAAAKDSRTWDNGAQDMADTKAILDAAKEYEEGTASIDQQDLLDVAAIKSSLEGDYGDETGGMYGAGKNLIEMAPYMAKFIINPAQGAGQASAKYVAKVGIEKFGKTAMKSLLGKIARTSARVVGDMASAAAITAAFDQGQVMADANKRLTGDVYSEKDEEGNIHYSGRSGQESSTGTALGKSVANDFEQNFGEMFGAYFSPVGKMLGRGAEKIASKIGLGKVSKMITEASNSDWIKGFKNFEKSAQWNGVLGEYGEEVVTNMMNAATVGDNTWDAAPGTGVFNKDLNFDTFLGVALGAGFMSAFKSGQYATGKYSAKRNLNASNSLATGLIGETKWSGFKNQIDNADDKDISGVMQNIMGDESLNDVQKKAAVQYTANLYRYHGANLQDVKSKMEGITTPQDEAFDKGVTVTDPKERNSVKLDLDKEAENIGTLFKDEPELLSSLQSDPNSTIQKMIDEGYDQDKIQSATDYTNTKSVYDGMIQGVREEIDEKVDDNNAKIAASTNQSDGMLHPVTMKDGSQMYIVSGNVSLYEDGAIDHNNSDKSLIIRDPETGEQKMISTTQLESIDQTSNAEEYRTQQEEEIRSYFAKQASDEIEGILQFLPGDTYDILDQEGNTKQITIQQPVGDGVNVQLTDGSIVPMSDIQNANNRLNLSQTQSVQSNIKQGDELKLNIGGTEVNATVSTSEDSDGKYQVSLESPVNGKSVLFMNSEDINSSIIPDKVTPEETKEQVPEVNEPITENTPETSAVEAPENDGIVRDEKGMPLYEQSPIESTISDMKKQGADENDILDYSSNMISDLDKESKALSKKKPEFSRDFATYKANKKALADQKEAIEKQKAYWKGLNDAISKPAEPTKTESPSLNKTTETPVIPTDSKPRNTGKYVKENKQMGDYLNLHDRVLRGIASGTKFLWNDDGIKKGLSTELGFKGSEGERRKRIGLIASKDKGGVSIDELAHNIWEEREGQSWQNDDVSDIKNEIISVLSDNNGTRSMIDEAMKMHEEPEEGDDSYEAQNYIAGLANSLHINPENMREYDSYIDDKTKNYYESASDDELNSIFAEKFLADENEINNKEDGQRDTGKIQEVRGQIPRGEESANGSTGVDNILQKGKSTSEGSVRQGSERKSSKNDNVRPNEDGNNILLNKSISESGEDQSRPKLDQYEPTFQAAKDKAKELDSEIEKQNNAVSKANKIVERKREEISSRNGLFGDTKSTELFNETSDLSSDNLHKALDKYIKDYDFEKNKLDDLLANRDKKLKDIDEAESKQVNMFTSETPEEANVKRMSDIEERLSDIDSLIMEHEDNNTSDALDMISLNKEKEDLESEYKGLKEINNESKNIQERKFSAPVIENESPLEYAQKVTEAHERFKEEQKTNTNPSEAQKEAGNYKKGHVKLDGYDISIENPKGSERSGKDANGNEWHSEMHNTYGYIRGTEGVDGDHIDVYLSDDPTKGDVYVVDQVDPKTKKFDEHKVMYGFPSEEEAKKAYLSNYEKDWKGLGTITKVSKEDFKKWVDSSHRKTKPFSEYKYIKDNKPKSIKDAKYDLMDAKRRFSVATSKGSPYTDVEIEEKRNLVKDAEDRLKELMKKNESPSEGSAEKNDTSNNNIRFSVKGKDSDNETEIRDALIDKMRKAGIDVITDQRGQDVLSKEHSYESDGIKYYRTANGEAYGYVKDGKIYIDTKIAGADTPIHEYTHLWSEVLRKDSPEEWKNIVSLMKELPAWNEIKERYTNLNNDDDLADEVLATYSGIRGAERLKEEKDRLLASESNIFSKAKIVDIFNRLKKSIEKYWNHVADFLNIHYTSAEDVADQALKDLINEVNPNTEMLHSNLRDENYIKTLDAADEEISDELEDKYHDDGEKKLTRENIGPILYDMSGRYTKLINMRGIPGMVVHDNKTDFDQAFNDYRSVSILELYQNKLREMLPRCTDAARMRVQDIIDGIDYTLDYYKRQAEGEEMWRTAAQPMFSLHNYSKPIIARQTYYQGRYDRLVNSTANKWKESYQDSMLGLKLLQQEVESESGEKIEDFENAYMAENQLSSKNRYATEFFRDNYFDPMLDEVHSLMKQGASYKDVLDYIMSKHGLERNELFADENEEELGERDYSGLSSIFSESEDYIQDAEDYVANFEEKYNTDALWSKINAATKETLRRSFEGGLLGKEEYEKIRDMFSFYIPLRGWNENVASDFYEYITSPKQVINPAVKKMKGRTSLADDPLATIGNMGESTILQAGRNQMKQKFLNMAMNHESSLLTVKNMWYVNHGTNDNPDWQRDIPEIGPDASADDIHTIIEEHEAKMKELEQAGFATKQRGKIQLKYHATYSEAGEHVVTVKRDGKEYTIYINGNPRAAQAINGLTNPDASNDSFFLKGVKRLNRQMSANFTSRNPAFVVSNLSRDIIFAGTAVAIKEPWRYTREYSKNIYILAPQMQMWSLLKKAHNGTLSKYIGIERYFKEFLENGGETGYTNLHSTDEYKKMIDRAIMESKGKVDLGRIFGLPPGKATTVTTLGIVPAFRFIAKWTEFLNRSAEDTTRFATFMTSRQIGRSIIRSISDAKEITVNFNKKGGNGHGAVFFRSIYLFFNPAVQGLQNMMRIAKDHPARFSTALFTFAAAGFIIPMLNRMLIDAFGGDDDKESYNNLPEWQRRNNFVFYCGKNHFVMVPLPIELRAFYGLGEMTYQMSNGNVKSEDAAKSVLAQMSDLMPVNLTGNNGDVLGSIMPDAFKPIYQSTVNVNYFGKPIYRKNEFNSLMPEYTKAYSGTSKALVKSAKFLNTISGGDNYTPGTLDVNPATVEHYFEGYFGGVGVTINQVGKSISALWDEDMRKTRNIPVVNRLLTTSDYNSNAGTTNEKFYKYMGEYELTKQRARGYKKEDRNGSIEYAKRIDFLENSPEYARMEIIDQYNKQLKKYQEGFKKAQDEGDDEAANDYKGMISEVKTEIVEELDKIK